MLAPIYQRHRITTKSANQMNNLNSQFIKIRKQILLLERRIINLEVEIRRNDRLEKIVIKLETDNKRHEAAIKDLKKPQSDLEDAEEEILL